MDPVNETPPRRAEDVAGYCRICGAGLTRPDVRYYQGTIYCAEHVPSSSSASYSTPPNTSTASASASTAAPTDSSTSPGLAFLLGLIPGVGAIYNGQYAKGFVHVLVAGLLFSLAGRNSGLEPLFGLMIPVWFFYMAFEAYHTAKKRVHGEPVDEFSSIMPSSTPGAGFPLLPILLIGLGVLFLLNNLDLIRIRQLLPYAGPIFLIGLGVYMLVGRLKPEGNGPGSEVSHERN